MAVYYRSIGGLWHAPRRISVVRNDRVVATKPESAVTFYVDGVARFTFFRREDCSDRSNKFITGCLVNFVAYSEFCVHGNSSHQKAGRF
jgi:hypothetical protein